MAKTRSEKVQTLADLTEALKSSKGLVFADYAGLTVKDMQELRRALRAQGVRYEVVKKTILSRALESAGLGAIKVEQLQGMISVAAGSDEVEAARQTVTFGQTHDKLQVLGGVLDANFIDAAKVKALAALPSKPQLLGQLVGTLSAPMSGLANVLAGTLRGLVQVLSQMATSK